MFKKMSLRFGCVLACFLLVGPVVAQTSNACPNPPSSSCSTSQPLVSSSGGNTNTDDLFIQALQGTLKSPSLTTPQSIVFWNKLPIPIVVRFVDSEGHWLQPNPTAATLRPHCKTTFTASGVIKAWPGKGAPIPATQCDVTVQYGVVIDEYSGALIDVIDFTKPNTTLGPFEISFQSLRRPNTLGMPPSPTDLAPVPSGSKLAVVGIGDDSSGYVTMHYQAWQKTSESQALAPREERTMQFTVSTGLQSSSSTLDVIAASLNTNVSAGWGPISATIGGSLSRNSTTQTSVYFQEESTTFEEKKYMNCFNDRSIVFYFWQLQDRYVRIDSGTGLAVWELATLQTPQIAEHSTICGVTLQPTI